MSSSVLAPHPATIPTELTAWVTRLRAGVILGLLALLMAGRALAHLPFAPFPVIAVALGASVYNAILAFVVWRTNEQVTPRSDRLRTWVLYVGGFLDTVALGLVVLFTGGLTSPWLYFFLATSIVSSAILPPLAGRVLTAVNVAAALLVITVSVIGGLLQPELSDGLRLWSQPGYAAVVGLSLASLMCLTAYAVSVPVESARAAARFQEGLAEITLALQRAGSVDQALAEVCAHAQRRFDADAAVLMLLEGEELVVRAVAGIEPGTLLGRRTPVHDTRSLEVDVLRRRDGFYVNHLAGSPYAGYPLVAELRAAAVLAVPLLGTLGVFGVLTLAERRRAGRFTPTVLQRAGILAAQAGGAVENARLLDRVREEADSVTGLLNAAERLTKSRDLPTLLTDLNRIAAEMVGCERSTTFLWDAHKQVFYFGSTFGNPPALADAMRHFEFARGAVPLIERVLAGDTFVVEAAETLALLPAELRTRGRLGASAVIPLITEDGVQGVMTVSYLNPARTFSAEQVWTLRGVARYAALAIERTRLIAQQQEAASTAEALVSIGRELSATLDRRRALSRIPEMAATAAGCDFAVLALWDHSSNQSRILGTHGFPAEMTDELLRLSLDTARMPFTATALRDGYLEIEHPQVLLDAARGIGTEVPAGSILCFLFGPIERRLGSLTVGYRTRTGSFSPAQKRLVNGIAQQAAVVLENTRLIDDLRRANRLKSDFLSTVSHELRTPLNAIIGYTDLLREQVIGPLQPEQLECLDVVAKKGVQLLELINTTLDLTRLEAGQVGIEVSEFALADVLTEIQSDLADEVPSQIEFRCTVTAALPRLHTDRLKVKTILKNLVHNALKFTPSGLVEVGAYTAPDPSQVEVLVRDTGIGIAPADVKAIFEMFRQLEPAMTRQFGGVGLGLYIVQRLLDLIGGTIHVHSQAGEGSVFTVTLPIRLP